MPVLPRPDSFESMSQRYGSRYKWLVLLVVGMGMVAGVLSTTSFNVAIPALTRYFDLGQDQVQWTMTGFMTAMTVAMLPTPWLLERFGFRRVFLISLVVLAAASIAGFWAPTFQLVVSARILQGFAAGVLQPMGPIALMRLFPPTNQGRAMGVMSFSITLTPALAPALGGYLLDHYGWATIFLLNLPFCAIAVGAALYLLPAPGSVTSKPFDWFGLGWLTLATIALVESIVSLQHRGLLAAWTLCQLSTAIAAILFYIRHAKRTATPIIGLGLLHQRTFAMGTVVAFAYGFGVYASVYLIPVFLQNALAYSAGSAGMALLPSGVALVLTLLVAGQLADQFSPKWLTAVGLAGFGLSFLAFAFWGGNISYTELIAATIFGRIGLGLVIPALSLATMRHLQPQELSQASVIGSYARQLGGVMGIAITAVFIEWRESVYGRVSPGIYTAYTQGFLLLSSVFLLAFLAACWMKVETPPSHP